MIFADNIVLINETHNGVNIMLKVWKQIQKSKGLMRRTKTEYLESKFSDVTNEADVEVRLDTQVIRKRDNFKYLQLIIQENGDIDKYITHLLV